MDQEAGESCPCDAGHQYLAVSHSPDSGSSGFSDSQSGVFTSHCTSVDQIVLVAAQQA